MKKILIIGFIFLFLPQVFAGNFTYEIINDKVICEMEFDSPEIIKLPLKYSDLKISGNYIQNEKIITIYSGKIEFTSNNLIEKSRQNNFFTVSQEAHKNSSIKLILPEGAAIHNESIVFPKNYSISTDGKNILIQWQKPNEKEIVVSYYEEKNLIYIYLLILIVSLFLVYVIYEKIQNNKKAITKNLVKEEKQIIEYLLKNKECWTKELVKNLNISKVKISRKLRSLEEKNLIEKVPFGNENKIKLKK